MIRQTLRFVLAASLLFQPSLARAFKEAGHRSIEAAAYEDLLRSEKGTGVLRTLIRAGVLQAPDPPSGSHGAHSHFAAHTVRQLPLRTHFPDHSFERQLHGARQCFHFNAAGHHVTDVHGEVAGLPRGIVEHAYLDCVGVADALLRNILFAPAHSRRTHTGVYALLHMLEDSFSEAHVARDQEFRIAYVKPWNLRTWARYFVYGGPSQENAPAWEHFSNHQHYLADQRDWGYLYREECRRERGNCSPRAMICLERASAILERNVDLCDLRQEVLVPAECLSDNGLRAAAAVADMLTLIAKHVEHSQTVSPGLAEIKGFDADWRRYRMKYLLHVFPELTDRMQPLSDPWNRNPGSSRPHDDLVWPAEGLAPKKYRTAGVGISTQLDAETPVWVGLDSFIVRDVLASDRINLGLDAFAWGLQIRLPLENSQGERPAGIAVDLGFGLPLNLAQLVDVDTPLTVYLGLRGRFAYDAQAVFEGTPRHVASVGFGGVSMDVVVANQVWLGFDAPRKMFVHDFWLGEGEWRDSVWSFSGGVATDAF